MTPQQALQILNQVRENASMNGKDHDMARQAMAVLNQFVQKHTEEDKGEEAKQPPTKK